MLPDISMGWQSGDSEQRELCSLLARGSHCCGGQALGSHSCRAWPIQLCVSTLHTRRGHVLRTPMQAHAKKKRLKAETISSLHRHAFCAWWL